MTLLTYLSLSALFLLARSDYRGLLVAVDDRIESISHVRNSTNLLPGNVFALSSPAYTGQDRFAFLFATELGAKVYRVEGEGVGQTILYSPQGELNFYISPSECHQNYYYQRITKPAWFTSSLQPTMQSMTRSS